MKLEWVNHASFILRHGKVAMISDPWLFGTAFDDGWSLLSETKLKPEDFGSITHLWLSHEHPDHFSPPSLRSIPDEHRAQITVLFQATEDKKIIGFCRDLGFKAVEELPPGEWHQLDDEVSVMCQPFPDDDSWLAVLAGEELLLNLNDCMVQSPRQIEGVRQQLGRQVDTLLTQFSYANWVGNRGETEQHRRVAEEHLDRVVRQVNILKPTFVVPFASFVRFTHQENAYLNEGMNTARDAYERILKDTEAKPVVLYPGDCWETGTDWDSSAALARYDEDGRRAADDGTLLTATQVPLAELKEMAGGFTEAVTAHHGRLRLSLLRRTGVLQPTTAYLTDYDRAVSFSLERGLRGSRKPREECDVELGSAALAYCFKHMWGGNTLLVNGRYQRPPGGKFERFRRYLLLSDLTNHDKGVSDYVLPRAQRVGNRILEKSTAALSRTRA